MGIEKEDGNTANSALVPHAELAQDLIAFEAVAVFVVLRRFTSIVLHAHRLSWAGECQNGDLTGVKTLPVRVAKVIKEKLCGSHGCLIERRTEHHSRAAVL